MNLPIKFEFRLETLEDKFSFKNASDVLIIRFSGELQYVSTVIHIFQEAIREALADFFEGKFLSLFILISITLRFIFHPGQYSSFGEINEHVAD